MALINCPECNREISDKAEVCIGCGYKLPKPEPLFDGAYCPKCLDTTIVADEIDTCPFCKTKYVKSIRGTAKECDDYCKNHPELKQAPEFDIVKYNYRINFNPNAHSPYNNVATCPTCKSSNIKRISGGKRFLSVGLFGLASSDVGKSMQCNNCGCKW